MIISECTEPHILILGGTADGRKIAERLFKKDIKVTYSVAGLVRTPNVPCDVVSGGFRQFGGLDRYIIENKMSAVLDVTHPYAKKISCKAIEAAHSCGIPCWRFQRPPWHAEADDNWFYYESWSQLLPHLDNKKSIFMTVGQLQQDVLNRIASNSQCKVYLRTAAVPKVELPSNVNWIKAIGPFDIASENSFMIRHQIDVLVSKNSGGESTIAKLYAARDLKIPVFMLTRPHIPPADKVFNSLEQCEYFLFEKHKV
ncbi:precorrin-6A/cobalt-precorrin-6A reductase [Agarilytica rhodophyticola]|uniref:precorrin-6A/cobalt-precorrin-6A reductase n=1 Tax=Agarilytica rhodophyticola TaxID=1737490 RepID=UPI000B346906|nr:precorrin-6A/cobalt-precorrin-6A reductase [Agarilytica rhodophyticola]